MADKRVWFITGAGRGMGVDIAQAALSAGHAVVATGRNTEAVADTVGEADDLLVLELDITSLVSAEAAVQAALERAGRIDVLVNNAGNFYAGYFEELTPEQIERSLTTNLVGPMNVTRAVLPVMRKQRSGNVVTITSTAGIVGLEFCSAYAAAKFGLEGWMESLRFEVEPFDIHTTIVEPGFFRTELLEKESTAYADVSIDDYAERTAQTRPAWEAMSGKQGGDPAKLAKALVTLVDDEQPPLRWVAGADAVETVKQKANDLLAQVDRYRDLPRRSRSIEHMTIQRMDHVGIVVDELAAATEFFVELGLVLEGEGSVEGRWVDRVVALEGVRADIAMLRTPDGNGRLELSKFHSPSSERDNRHAPANTPGIRHVSFAVDDLDAVVAGLRARGAELVGELERYEDSYRLCYVRGPEGIIIELAERIG